MFKELGGHLRSWVIVLEIMQVGRAGVGDLKSDALTSRTVECRNSVRITGSDIHARQVVGNFRSVVVSGVLRSGRLQFGDVDLPIAIELVR